MIKGHCRTNWDAFKGKKWPTEFVFPPRIGDWVKAECGLVAKVYNVTHYMHKVYYSGDMGGSGIRLEPRIEIEIHKTTGG